MKIISLRNGTNTIRWWICYLRCNENHLFEKWYKYNTMMNMLFKMQWKSSLWEMVQIQYDDEYVLEDAMKIISLRNGTNTIRWWICSWRCNENHLFEKWYKYNTMMNMFLKMQWKSSLWEMVQIQYDDEYVLEDAMKIISLRNGTNTIRWWICSWRCNENHLFEKWYKYNTMMNMFLKMQWKSSLWEMVQIQYDDEYVLEDATKIISLRNGTNTIRWWICSWRCNENHLFEKWYKYNTMMNMFLKMQWKSSLWEMVQIQYDDEYVLEDAMKIISLRNGTNTIRWWICSWRCNENHLWENLKGNPGHNSQIRVFLI